MAVEYCVGFCIVVALGVEELDHVLGLRAVYVYEACLVVVRYVRTW